MEHIFGPKVGSLKGKAMRTGQTRVRVNLLPIPAVTMDRYERVALAGDVMKVNRIPFLVTMSRAIKFETVELLTNQKMWTLLTAIKNVQNLYMH